MSGGVEIADVAGAGPVNKTGDMGPVAALNLLCRRLPMRFEYDGDDNGDRDKDDDDDEDSVAGNFIIIIAWWWCWCCFLPSGANPRIRCCRVDKPGLKVD